MNNAETNDKIFLELIIEPGPRLSFHMQEGVHYKMGSSWSNKYRYFF